jgi:FMN reductase
MFGGFIMTKIVAIAGSPSHPSRSYAVLEEVQHILHSQGISLDIVLVRDQPADALLHAQFNHPVIEAATNRVADADAVIISTPVYKASYTGILKAFLDLLPQKALLGKPVLPIATGGTLAHLLAIDYALNPVLGVLGATYILQGVYFTDNQFQRLDQGGIQISDPELETRFHNAISYLAQVAHNARGF